MPVIVCSECRHPISDWASACPGCGHPVGVTSATSIPSTSTSPSRRGHDDDRATPDPPSSLSATVRWSLLVLLGVGFLALADVAQKNNPERQYGSKEMAAFMCEDFVKRRLLSPGSAQFPNPLLAGVQIDSVGAGRYTVGSYYYCVRKYPAPMLRRSGAGQSPVAARAMRQEQLPRGS
jgi:hypothetical protein